MLGVESVIWLRRFGYGQHGPPGKSVRERSTDCISDDAAQPPGCRVADIRYLLDLKIASSSELGECVLTEPAGVVAVDPHVLTHPVDETGERKRVGCGSDELAPGG